MGGIRLAGGLDADQHERAIAAETKNPIFDQKRAEYRPIGDPANDRRPQPDSDTTGVSGIAGTLAQVGSVHARDHRPYRALLVFVMREQLAVREPYHPNVRW